jgi:hypothetical protein
MSIPMDIRLDQSFDCRLRVAGCAKFAPPRSRSRVIYAEYTLAATDLLHVSGDHIRDRTSVIRAIEAA